MKNALLATVAVVAVAGSAWFLNRPVGNADLSIGAAFAQEADLEVNEVLITEMAQGDPEAAVEVIEYASFTCPHCANFHDQQYAQLKENYIDTGKIRFVFREAYFDRPGLWASMIARCGGEVRYFGIVDLIFDRQQTWARRDSGEAIIEDLRQIGKVAGLTDEDLDTCLADGQTAESLYGWYQANLEEHDIGGTPSFVINGEVYSNMAYADFAAILDEKLAAAEGGETAAE